jgi:hypothetical protein
MMAHVRTRLLLAAATLVTGILAGGIIDRVIVGGPAWHELGAAAWVRYSRSADLGMGLIAYPVEGIGATLLIIGATVSNWWDDNARQRTAYPLYLAVAFSLLGLLLTLKARRSCWRLRRLKPRTRFRRLSMASSYGASTFAARPMP